MGDYVIVHAGFAIERLMRKGQRDDINDIRDYRIGGAWDTSMNSRLRGILKKIREMVRRPIWRSAPPTPYQGTDMDRS